MPSAQPPSIKLLMTLIHWWLRQWLMFFFSTSNPPLYQQTCSRLKFSDLISKDILPYFNTLSAPKITPWTLSSAPIHKFKLHYKFLIPWAYTYLFPLHFFNVHTGISSPSIHYFLTLHQHFSYLHFSSYSDYIWWSIISSNLLLIP